MSNQIRQPSKFLGRPQRPLRIAQPDPEGCKTRTCRTPSANPCQESDGAYPRKKVPVPRKARTLHEAVELILSRATPELGGCLRLKPSPSGYASLRAEGRIQLAHRVVWIALRGPVPDGYDLDHLCHSRDRSCLGGTSCPHRSCVNVDHLEPVTHTENVRRGVVASRVRCTNGHALTEANTYWKPDGHRQCRRCNNESCRDWRRRQQLRAAGIEAAA